ncbi:hypothetical protein GCM10027287_42880 [Bordetella muralis]
MPGYGAIRSKIVRNGTGSVRNCRGIGGGVQKNHSPETRANIRDRCLQKLGTQHIKGPVPDIVSYPFYVGKDIPT